MNEDFVNHDKHRNEQETGNRTSSPSMVNLFSNRDVLARRLKCRLDREDLIVRGIMPPQNTSPNIVAQIHQLERAKAGDMLQRKIRVRSSRQQLVQRHILADSKIAASLQEKQSSLERHRIADHLNEQLFNRPGPLELIKDNILEVEPRFADAVKHGCVQFHPTCKDVSTSPMDGTITESLISDQDSRGAYIECISPLSTDSIDTFTQAFSEHVNVNNVNDLNNQWCSSYLSNDDATSPNICDPKPAKDNRLHDSSQKSDGTRELSFKKQLKQSKKKQQIQNKSKVKKYKYHEYKPPGTVPQTYQAPLDARYKRLLEQQQMFLQLQVMKQNAMFAAMKSSEDNAQDTSMIEECKAKDTTNLHSVSTITESTPSHGHQSNELHELRVIDLRSQLRQRGLPVSGSKARLLERLRSYEDKKALEKEKQAKLDEKNKSYFSAASPSSVSHSVNPDVIQSCSNASSSSAFIKVTTYATQNGQTFQVVQAVPNMQQQYQYQLIPQESVLFSSSNHLHQSPITHFQAQKTDLPIHNYKSYSMDNSLVTLPSNFFPTNNVAVIRPENENTSLQNTQFLDDGPNKVLHQLNLEVLPVHSAALTTEMLDDDSQFLNTATRSSASNFQAQQQDRKAENTFDHARVRRPFVKSTGAASDETLSCGNELSRQSSLLDHLEQLQNSINLPSNTGTLLNREQKIDSPNLAVHDCLPFNNAQSNRYDRIRPVKSPTFSPGRYSVHRNRSHTDPTGFETSQTHSSLHCGDTSPIVMQQNGTVVVVTCGMTEAKDSSTFSTSIKEPITAIKQETSEDLLDILGEISESVRPSLHSPSVHGNKACQVTTNGNSNYEAKQGSGEFLTPFFKSKHTNSESFTATRTFSSLPGDLNRLDTDLHDLYGVSFSSHTSCSTLTKDVSEPSHLFLRSASAQAGSPATMMDEADSECVSMDVDGDAYLVDNDLDWLNLNPKSNHSTAPDDNSNTMSFAKETDDLSMNICTNSFDLPLSTVHPNDVLSKPGESMFDCDNGHQLIMAIDANDYGKLTF